MILLGQEEDERTVVRIIGEQGKAIQTIPIPESMQEVLWSTVAEDGASGVWLGEGDVLVRLGPSGEVLAQHKAHLADGSCFPVDSWLSCVVQRSQDGLLWSANDHVIASIDAAGQPGPFVGQRIPPVDTRGAYALGVDRLGRIWVQHEDLRTTSWFDSQGKFLFHDSLPMTMEAFHPASCEVDFDGRIWWKTNNFGTYYVLQADGTPLGLRHKGPRFGSIRFAAGVEQVWACDETSVFRWDAKGAPSGTITKRPDGCWWRDITGWDVSEDGKQLAVVDTLRAGALGEGCLIAILDTTSGESRFLDIPISGSLYSPPREVQLAGDWLLVGACLIHVPTLRGVLLTLSQKEESVPTWQLDPDGTYLIRLSWQDPLTVQAFALPEFD